MERLIQSETLVVGGPSFRGSSKGWGRLFLLISCSN